MLGWVLQHGQDDNPSGQFATNVRELVDDLIDFLDGIDSDPDLEPNLGSVGDQHFDQTTWAGGTSRDLEVDDGNSGVADLDGLLEQVGCGGWQGDRTGMG